MDALHKLLPTTKVSLPSSQVTFERVQHLLNEKGQKELALNLRAELDKGLCSMTMAIVLGFLLSQCSNVCVIVEESS